MRSKIILKSFIVISLTGLLNFSCSSSLSSFSSPNNILGKLGNQPDLSSFVACWKKFLLSENYWVEKSGNAPCPYIMMPLPVWDRKRSIISPAVKTALKELDNIAKKHIIPGKYQCRRTNWWKYSISDRKPVQIGDAKIVGTPSTCRQWSDPDN